MSARRQSVGFLKNFKPFFHGVQCSVFLFQLSFQSTNFVILGNLYFLTLYVLGFLDLVKLDCFLAFPSLYGLDWR